MWGDGLWVRALPLTLVHWHIQGLYPRQTQMQGRVPDSDAGMVRCSSLCIPRARFGSVGLPQLVNYTAHLTEERDELSTTLEEVRKKLEREIAARVTLESKTQQSQNRSVSVDASTESGFDP